MYIFQCLMIFLLHFTDFEPKFATLTSGSYGLKLFDFPQTLRKLFPKQEQLQKLVRRLKKKNETLPPFPCWMGRCVIHFFLFLSSLPSLSYWYLYFIKKFCSCKILSRQLLNLRSSSPPSSRRLSRGP